MAALTRNKIAEKALQKVGNLARGQTANPDDRQIALDSLDRLIKSLPIHGYTVPAVLPSDPVVYSGLVEEWDEALILGVAAEIGDEFSAPANDKIMWLQQWSGLRQKLVDYTAPKLPDRIGVSEYRRPCYGWPFDDNNNGCC